MKINSDINILGGMADFDLVLTVLREKEHGRQMENHASVKTRRSLKRFRSSIENNFLSSPNGNIEELVANVLKNEGITKESRIVLFWAISLNNELFHSMNSEVFFPAYFSGRTGIRKDDALAYLVELSLTQKSLESWSPATKNLTASKYLTLLKKFTLLTGARNKQITLTTFSDRLFTLFVYWLAALDGGSNLLQSKWLSYSLTETNFFQERITQKRFKQYFEVQFTGDVLRVKTLINYKDIYGAITVS